MKEGYTPTEKVVLHGLIKYPTLNDRELSEVINVKPSTTTAIRRRLRNREVFYTKRIPMPDKLGYELIIVFCGTVDPKVKKADMSTLTELIRQVPEIFLSFRSSDSVFAISYFKSFTEYRIFADAVWEGFGESGLINPDRWFWSIFALETSKLLNFFDYGSPLRSVFGIKERTEYDKSFERLEPEKLSKKERLVLRGLVEHPESSDKAVAEKIGASRQAVSAMRKRFEEKGILRTVRIVNLEKVGYNILALAYSLFGPKAPLKVRWPGIERIAEITPTFLNISSNPESILFAAAESYDQFYNVKNEVVKLYSGKGYLRAEPTMMLFPLSDTSPVKDFDFSGLMERYVQEED